MDRRHLGFVVTCLAASAACGDDEAKPADAGTPDAAPDKGTFTLSWTIETSGGGAVTCAQANADSVLVSGMSNDIVFGFNDAFGCVAGEVTSALVPPGSYRLEVDLVDGTSSVLDEPNTINSVIIPEGGDVPVVTVFVVDP